MARILIIDDEASIGWGLSQLATRLGHEATTASSAEAGLEEAARANPDLIFLDVRLPGMDGLTAMGELRKHCPKCPIVVITAFGALDTAVKAVQQGAFEYLIKPFNTDDIEQVIRRAFVSIETQDQEQGENLDSTHDVVGGLVGSSQPMQEAFKRIALASSTDAPILISGASGTGKELAARAIHENSSRSSGPFVPVNLAALSETLAESELFGHVKGAYTGASENRTGFMVLAHQGTLFLDEVADIPLALQVKLLRTLENGEVTPVGSSQPVGTDFRIIAATHQSLQERIEEGDFRHDLYFRLAAYQIDMPSLSERGSDIKDLAEHFLLQISKREHKPCAHLSDATVSELLTRDWPGNVRELRNAMEHAFIVSRGTIIDPTHLPDSGTNQALKSGNDGSGTGAERLTQWVADWTQQRIERGESGNLYADLMRYVEPPLFSAALNAHQGQFVAAAKALGMHRTTLRKKFDEYDLGQEESD